jgi:hypothetical protein
MKIRLKMLDWMAFAGKMGYLTLVFLRLHGKVADGHSLARLYA